MGRAGAHGLGARGRQLVHAITKTTRKLSLGVRKVLSLGGNLLQERTKLLVAIVIGRLDEEGHLQMPNAFLGSQPYEEGNRSRPKSREHDEE
jgi:hypothetical protein